MTDTERLNLIEHYFWTVKRIESIWHIITVGGIAKDKSLRNAVDVALDMQRKWSIGV